MLIEKYKIDELNQDNLSEHKRKFEFVASSIKNVDEVLRKLTDFQIAIPSWALGTGGTRFALQQLKADGLILLDHQLSLLQTSYW